MTFDSLRLAQISRIVQRIVPRARSVTYATKVVCSITPSRWPSEVKFDLYGHTSVEVAGHGESLYALTKDLASPG